jgi:hypothetical protein
MDITLSSGEVSALMFHARGDETPTQVLHRLLAPFVRDAEEAQLQLVIVRFRALPIDSKPSIAAQVIQLLADATPKPPPPPPPPDEPSA